MKKQLSLVSRLALTVAAAGALCCAGSAYAIDETSTAARATAKPSASPSPGESANQQRSNTAPVAGGGEVAPADRQFMMTAAKDGMREVHMGQMAAQQGQSPEIKKLGNTIMSDHTKANNQLMALAQKKKVKLDTSHKMDKMSKKDMANFDQAWLRMMVADHRKDIGLYQQHAQSGIDPEVKAFARKTLPVLQKHLKLVQAAQAKMGGGAGDAGGASGGQGGTSGSR